MKEFDNAMASEAGWWQARQKAWLQYHFPNAGLQPAFPGSMLFNQILIPSCPSSMELALLECEPDSLNVVYQYCGNVESTVSNIVLLDAGDDYTVNNVHAVLDVVSCQNTVSELWVIGDMAVQLKAAVEKELPAGLSVKNIQPDWRSEHDLHRLYRSATHIVFANTARVLDAAFTGCDCTLVVSDGFYKTPGFGLLHTLLLQTQCNVLQETSALAVEISKTDKLPFMVASNNISDVRNKIAGITYTDWLQQCQFDKAGAVIDGESSVDSNFKSEMLDRKTKILRKGAKLINDPKSFFKDSGYSVFQSVSRAIFDRRK